MSEEDTSMVSLIRGASPSRHPPSAALGRSADYYAAVHESWARTVNELLTPSMASDHAKALAQWRQQRGIDVTPPLTPPKRDAAVDAPPYRPAVVPPPPPPSGATRTASAPSFDPRRVSNVSTATTTQSKVESVKSRLVQEKLQQLVSSDGIDADQALSILNTVEELLKDQNGSTGVNASWLTKSTERVNDATQTLSVVLPMERQDPRQASATQTTPPLTPLTSPAVKLTPTSAPPMVTVPPRHADPSAAGSGMPNPSLPVLTRLPPRPNHVAAPPHHHRLHHDQHHLHYPVSGYAPLAVPSTVSSSAPPSSHHAAQEYAQWWAAYHQWWYSQQQQGATPPPTAERRSHRSSSRRSRSTRSATSARDDESRSHRHRRHRSVADIAAAQLEHADLSSFSPIDHRNHHHHRESRRRRRTSSVDKHSTPYSTPRRDEPYPDEISPMSTASPAYAPHTNATERGPGVVLRAAQRALTSLRHTTSPETPITRLAPVPASTLPADDHAVETRNAFGSEVRRGAALSTTVVPLEGYSTKRQPAEAAAVAYSPAVIDKPYVTSPRRPRRDSGTNTGSIVASKPPTTTSPKRWSTTLHPPTDAKQAPLKAPGKARSSTASSLAVDAKAAAAAVRRPMKHAFV